MIRLTRSSLVVALLGGGLAGACLATQARANGALAAEMHNAYFAAAISFAIALSLLLLALPLSRSARRGFVRVREELSARRMPWWAVFGGACGAFILIAQGLAVATLGMALFTIGIVAGQVFGGFVLDLIGLGTGSRVFSTPQRMLGMALALLAVVVSMASDLGSGVSASWMLVLPLIGGLMVSLQTALNGVVRVESESAFTATLVSYIGGAALVMIIAAFSVVVSGWPPVWSANPWAYLGGLVGPGFIVLTAIFVRKAGVLLLGMSIVAGQLLASVLFELLLPFTDGLTVWLVVGTVLAFVAVVVAALPSRAPELFSRAEQLQRAEGGT